MGHAHFVNSLSLPTYPDLHNVTQTATSLLRVLYRLNDLFDHLIV